MKNIVLTGFMGAGKSSVGKRLGKRLKMSVIDTDDVIEKDSGMKISDIFAEHGEKYFRGIEKKAVKKVSHVIITGGGVVLDKDNMKNLRKNSVIVYLHATPEAVYNRVKEETHRPLLHVKDPLKKIEELLLYRAPFYADNDIRIETSNLSIREVVDEVVRKVKSF